MQYAGGKVTQGKKWRKTMSGLGDRWVEPFCGGLGAYQQIAPSYRCALISDASPIIKMWEAVRDGWLPDVGAIGEREKQVKAAFGDDPTPQSVYVSHAGGFRGMVTKASSQSDRIKPGVTRLLKIKEVLCSVPTEIRQCDYKVTLRECGRGDVVYLDPPYTAQGKIDYRSWLVSPEVMTFDQNEMMALADEAISRGAIIFLSHYSHSLDFTKWKPVEVHTDQSPSRVKGQSVISHNSELLYVDIRTYYRFDFRGDVERVKRNRRASQSSVRQDLIGLMGFRCEATGEVLPKSQLALTHGTGFEYSKTGDSSPEYCYLVNVMFHAAMDDPEMGVRLENDKWFVPIEHRDKEWAKGAHGELAKRFRNKSRS